MVLTDLTDLTEGPKELHGFDGFDGGSYSGPRPLHGLTETLRGGLAIPMQCASTDYR